MLTLLRANPINQTPSPLITRYVFFANPVFAVCIALYDMYTNELFKEYCTRDADLAAECADQGIIFQDSSLSWEDHPYVAPPLLVLNSVAREC
jgi:hypothetical protein